MPFPLNMCISKEKEVDNKAATNQEDDSNNEADEEMEFRIYSIFSYFIILIVIGLPIWWFTTRVYRANLPLSKIEEFKLRNKNTSKEFGIPLSLEYDILISFVHPDPGGMDILLNGEDIDKNLQPLLTKLTPIADFVVKSQWLYLTELGSTPYKHQDHYVLQEHQLPHVITPLETKLWSNISPRPTLNLVIYFPPCGVPLYIYSDDVKVESNAFLSPRWGGIFIMNSDNNSCQKRQFKPNLQPIVGTFTTQIKELFKINNISDPEDIQDLKIRKSTELLDSTRRTLKSLAHLLLEISSIVISDEVAEKINASLINADLAETYLYNNEIDKALDFAKIAFANSEAAFSDPSLLALLYFPEDQKYAVYIPLFLPIMIPVLMSLCLVKKWKTFQNFVQNKKKTD